MAAHGLLDALDEAIQFIGEAFGHHLDPPVAQVAYKTGYTEPQGNDFGRVAKADALNAPGKKDLPPDGLGIGIGVRLHDQIVGLPVRLGCF